MTVTDRPPMPAVVAVAGAGAGLHRYLRVCAEGAHEWVDDLQAATRFESLREAMRVAMRLPARLKAFGLPRPALTA